MSRIFDQAIAWLISLLRSATILFLVTPLLVSLLMSFDARSFLGAFPPTSFSFKWYERLFTESIYVHGFINSLIIGFTSTAISVGLGLFAAIGLVKGRFPGREALRGLFLAPLVVPAVVIGFGLLIAFSYLGVGSAYARMIIAHCVITIPYVIRSVVSLLENLSPSLDEAALSLGATPWGVVRTIMLPLARSGSVVGGVLAFTVSLDDVSVGIFLADPQSTTLPIALVSMMRSNFDLSIAAASAVMILIAFAALLLIEWVIGVEHVFGTKNTGR